MTLVVVAILLALPTLVAYAQTKPRVAVDFSSLDKAFYDQINALELEKQLVLRLVQEGFAVVAAAESPDILVRYQHDERLRVVVSAGELKREIAIEVPAQDDLAEFQLQVSQKTVEIVREMPSPEPPPRSAPNLPRPATISESATPLDITSPPEPHSVAIMAGVGMLRRGAMDPQVSGAIELQRGRLRLHGTISFVPASNDDVAITEWQVQAGGGWAIVQSQIIWLSVGASVGLLVHRYELERAGTRVDPLVSLPVTASYQVSGPLAAWLRVAPGIAKAREHTMGDVTLWQRDRVRFELQIGLSYRL
ncbi:MAG: hypothetical protein AB7P03_11815 [Kofleriaceae bacterium]